MIDMILKGSFSWYQQEVISQLKKDLKCSVMETPKLLKIVLNMGLGEAKNNKNIIAEGINVMSLISGQKPISTLAKHSIAGFKLREDMPIGVKVTLRKKKMYDFLSRLINIAIPRIKDFHGLNRKNFDGNGNYSLGLVDIGIFPEFPYNHSSLLKGIGLVFVTNTTNDKHAQKLLEFMGMPFVASKKN